jgi:hypothetical protein
MPYDSGATATKRTREDSMRLEDAKQSVSLPRGHLLYSKSTGSSFPSSQPSAAIIRLA